MIAVSLNVGGGVLLIKLAKLFMCTQILYKHKEGGRTSPVMRGHGTAEPLRERRCENWITITIFVLQIHTIFHDASATHLFEDFLSLFFRAGSEASPS